MPECQICFQQKLLINLTNSCSHQFCQQCCLSHIRQKAQRFNAVLCPSPQCQQEFKPKQNQKLFSKLDEATQNKINSFIQYKNNLENPHLKACSQPNCNGRINIKQNKRVCNICGLKHCKQCSKAFHEGACIIDEHDIMMREANNQKCPTCQIWVEKKQGCNFIDCKCGTQFCYICGNPFATDPCRRKQAWAQEDEIRRLLTSLKIFNLQSQLSSLKKIGFIFIETIKIVLKLPILLIYLFVMSILLYLCIAFILGFLIMFSPIIAIFTICMCGQKLNILLRMASLLLLPIVTAMYILLFVVGILFYPILRQTYHHGVYDAAQNGLNKFAIFFLRGLVCILYWCRYSSEEGKKEIKPNAEIKKENNVKQVV